MNNEYFTLEWVQDYIANRVRVLREDKGVTAQGMSLDLGQNKSYINKIENQRNSLSVEGLYYICDYFGITLNEFFDNKIEHPETLLELMEQAKQLDRDSLKILIELARKLNSQKQS